MIYSNNRKLYLSGWLLQHDTAAYNSPLRLQKFLFLYEAFSKADGDDADFDRLKGYKRGPVFSSVWGDYTKERDKFSTTSIQAYSRNIDLVNSVRAERAAFIVASLSENELSELSHLFHIWHSKKNRIMDGELHVALDEQDFNDADCNLAKLLEKMYPTTIVQNSIILPIGDRCFVFAKTNYTRLTEQHLDILSSLAMDVNLHNPVFVEIDDDGRLSVE